MKEMRQFGFYLIFILLVSINLLACHTTAVPASNTQQTTRPQELDLYEQYRLAITEPLGAFDEFVIEATVLSLNQMSVCPYQTEETCPIEAYPNDWAIIRIDRVISFESSQTVIGGVSDGDTTGQTTDQNQGIDIPPKKIEPLPVGQELNAQFVLTTQPAIVRRIPAPAKSQNQENTSAPDVVYKPLPKENGHYIFTIGTTTSNTIEETILAGLHVNDRFRASVQYDGSLRVLMYEKLP